MQTKAHRRKGTATPDAISPLTRIGALSESEVREALDELYRSDATIRAVMDSGCSDQRACLVLYYLLSESRRQSLDLLHSMRPATILIDGQGDR